MRFARCCRTPIDFQITLFQYWHQFLIAQMLLQIPGDNFFLRFPCEASHCRKRCLGQYYVWNCTHATNYWQLLSMWPEKNMTKDSSSNCKRAHTKLATQRHGSVVELSYSMIYAASHLSLAKILKQLCITHWIMNITPKSTEDVLRGVSAWRWLRSYAVNANYYKPVPYERHHETSTLGERMLRTVKLYHLNNNNIAAVDSHCRIYIRLRKVVTALDLTILFGGILLFYCIFYLEISRRCRWLLKIN